MTVSIARLRSEYEKAEAAALQLQADKDKDLEALRQQYTARLRQAVDRASKFQKRLCDAEAAQALAAREDLSDTEKTRLAETLGLEI